MRNAVKKQRLKTKPVKVAREPIGGVEMAATTVGLGPFQPAIRVDGEFYVLDRQMDSEDKAVLLAQMMCGSIQRGIMYTLNVNGWKVQ